MAHAPSAARRSGEWKAATRLAALVLGLAGGACAPTPPEGAVRGAAAAPAPPPSRAPEARPSVDPWGLPADTPADELEAGAGRERRFDSASPHVYALRLETGECVRVRAQQRGVDLALRVVAPDGRARFETDFSEGLIGAETVMFVAEAPGEYRLLARPLGVRDAGDYRLSVEAMRPASPTDERQARAFALTSAADALLATGETPRLRDAARLYERAGREWGALGAENELAYTLRQRGRAHGRLHERPRALELLGRALSLARRRGDRREEARVLDEMGPLYRQNKRPAEAQAAYYRALALARGVGDVQLEATVLNDLGVLAAEFSGPDMAAALYEKALLRWRPTGALRHEATTLYNLAGAYDLLGRPERSGPLLARALLIQQDAGNKRGQVLVLKQMGWSRYLAKDPEGALGHYHQAWEGARSLDDEELVAMLADRRASALMRRAEQRRCAGKERAAERLACEQSRLAELGEAAAGYHAALETWRRLRDPRSVAHTTSSLALLEQALDHPAEALRLFDLAVVGLHDAQEFDSEALVRGDRARLLVQTGDLRAALRDVEQALEQQERLRAGIALAASRASYLGARHKLFDVYVDVLMRLDQVEPNGGHAVAAFDAAERGRARALLDSLVEGRHDDADKAVLARDDELRARINLEEETGRLLQERTSSSDEMDAHRARLAEMVREREELRRIPAAARQRTWAGEPLRLADIRGLLDSETLLLVYALGPEHSFAWLVGQDVFEKCWLPPREKIVQLARAVHASLQDSRRVGARHQGRLHARALSDVLLGPFAGRLGRKRLLIVSDDVLQYVPFAVLPVVPSQPPRPAGDATDGRVLLLAEHEVLCVPSGSVLAHLRREAVRRARPPRVAAVFADPVFHAKDERLAGGGGAGRPSQAESSNMSDLQRSASAVGLRFVRLPWSRNEAQAILERVRDSTAFGALDFDASRETVLSAPLHEFGVVHFATHGIINADEPSLSGIVLSLVDSDGRVQDGFLRPHDIERLDLRADLVVLSACRTALGHEVDGEGIVGLTQAFLRAGALRVLVSLWNVGDHTTAELMRRFYDGLLVKKLPPAAALRQAQLSMANDRRYAAPANWAGFVLEGDW